MRWKDVVCLVPLVLVGCEVKSNSPMGFLLPDGDTTAGQAAFTDLQCGMCHTVEGTELPTDGDTRPIDVALGGQVIRVQTYGELVTAVINPSHDLVKGYDLEAISVDGTSLMADSNDRMTVQQLIDIVAYLQASYTKHLPDDYKPYIPLGLVTPE